MMSTETISTYLEGLGARQPTPGGGAVAGIHAAQAAALVAMVARYSSGEKYKDHAAEISAITEKADILAARAIQLADDDEKAFSAVGDAYKLPRDTDGDKAKRKEAIAAATANAAVPPVGVIGTARQIIDLAQTLLPIGNRNVITDIAAAAEAARAAATTSRVNVEINLPSVKDEAVRAQLLTATEQVSAIAADAENITSQVREVISR
ncbi:cyclodeaminase/cyclohydrolase family protein [Nocardiopsis tropica]